MANYKHGKRYSRIYKEWRGMIDRTKKSNNLTRNKNYYEKGIKVCEQWANDFMNFYSWAMDNGYNDNLTLDRIDNNKGYCPENCRWADINEQANNRSNNHIITYNGKSQTVMQWAKEIGTSPSTLYSRIKRGWSTEKLLYNKDFTIKLIEYNGKTQSLKDWAKELNINYNTLASRVSRYKENIEQAFMIKEKNVL